MIKDFKKEGFTIVMPGIEYKNMNLTQIYKKNDFRIDLFERKVCGKFSLSNEMIERSEKVLEYDKLKVFICSNEDVFLFKTMTERDGDIDDCMGME